MIKKYKLFRIYEFDYEEQWINELAQEGLHFVKKEKRNYYFEQSDNCGRRYKVIPKKRKEFEDEEIQLFKDSGWEFLCEEQHVFSWFNQCFFYTDKKEAPELFTDDDSYRNYLYKARRFFIVEVILSFFIALFFIPWVLLYLEGFVWSLSSMYNSSMLEQLALIGCEGVLTIFWINEGIGYYKSIKRILGSDADKQKRSYRNRRIITGVIGVILLISLIICMVINNTGIKGKDVLTYNNHSPALFREFDPEMWEYVSKHLGDIPPNAEKGIKYDCTINNFDNLILAEGSEEYIYATDGLNINENGEAFTLEYLSLTYDYKSEKTANKLLLKEIVYKTTDQDFDEAVARKQADRIKIDVPDTDYAGYYEEKIKNYPNYQYLFLRKGTRVVYVEYCGKQKLTDKLGLFTDQL